MWSLEKACFTRRGLDSIVLPATVAGLLPLTPFWSGTLKTWQKLKWKDEGEAPGREHAGSTPLFELLHGRVRLLVDVNETLRMSNFIYLSDVWDYTRGDFMPVSQVVSYTVAERALCGTTHTQITRAITRIYEALENHHLPLLARMRSSRMEAGDAPLIGQWWGALDEDIAGCITNINTAVSCGGCMEGRGSMLRLTTFPSAAGYGKLRSEPSAEISMCSCCMGRLNTDTTHSYGVLNTSIVLPQRLRGLGAVGIRSAVKDLRGEYLKLHYKAEDSTLAHVPYWQLLIGTVPITEAKWERWFMSVHRARVSGRARSLMWKIYHRNLPLNVHKHIQLHHNITESCTLCGRAPETDIHLFTDCPLAKVVWTNARRVLSLMRLNATWSQSPACILLGEATAPSALNQYSWVDPDAPPSQTAKLRFTTELWAELRGIGLNIIWTTRNEKRTVEAIRVHPQLLLHNANAWWFAMRILAVSKLYPSAKRQKKTNKNIFESTCWNLVVPTILDRLKIKSIR